LNNFVNLCSQFPYGSVLWATNYKLYPSLKRHFFYHGLYFC